MYQMVEKGSGVIKNVEIFKIEVEFSTHWIKYFAKIKQINENQTRTKYFGICL